MFYSVYNVNFNELQINSPLIMVMVCNEINTSILILLCQSLSSSQMYPLLHDKLHGCTIPS